MSRVWRQQEHLSQDLEIFAGFIVFVMTGNISVIVSSKIVPSLSGFSGTPVTRVLVSPLKVVPPFTDAISSL